MKAYCLLGEIIEPDAPPPTAVEAIRLATLGGAARAGVAKKIGAIEPGMLDDIIALDLNDPAFRPLNSVARQVVYSETGRAVRHVWVDGRHVVANGATTRVDEARLVEDMAAVMPGVTKQLDKLRGDALVLKGYFPNCRRGRCRSRCPTTDIWNVPELVGRPERTLGLIVRPRRLPAFRLSETGSRRR